jgi:hypothetical protein
MKRIVTIFLLTLLATANCFAVTVENPRDDLYVTPGSQSQTSFRVINRSGKSQQMTVYQTDYSFKADGTTEFGSPGSHPRSNAEWLSFSPKQFTIEPNAKITINVSANVPDEPLVGTYWSVLMVEYIDDPQKQAAVTVKRRQGIQIRTHFSNTGELKARYFNQKIKKANDKTLFEVDMENTGTLFYSGKFWVEFFDNRGKPVEKIEVNRKSV